MKTNILAAIVLIISLSSQAKTLSDWDKAIKQVTNSVVSIRINVVRNFDTEANMSSQATGFVVDAERGIILTNRHVVNPGPVTAEAIFSNKEEIALKPLYRDPVHDFGFFQYNPKALKFITPQALKLNDNAATIGDEIRVIGNDSGEHMSILSGTIARTDRSAPKYRAGGYNDFNTFYFQSSADTSGGSSGSPVVNINAEVIGLNAGGHNSSSSSFFLPLYKVSKALKSIQEQQPISRGTLQMTLDYQPYDVVRRLGLPANIEQKFRQRNQGDGLLIVESVVIDGPASKQLKPGDIVISLKSSKSVKEYVSRYEQFEFFLDEHVGESIELTILRQGEPLKIPLKVEDLHQITPYEYVEIGGGVLNNFSYQLARQTNLPVKGVYVAASGFMFGNAGIRRGAIIQQLDQKPINNLQDLIKSLSNLKQNQHFTIKYVLIGSPTKQQIANVKFQTQWHLSKHCQRNVHTGNWPCKALKWSKGFTQIAPTEVNFPVYKDKRLKQISRSLVMVKTDLPYYIDGQSFPNYAGTGLVIDADKGLVVVDRNTVPIKMANVTINIAGVIEIPAEIVFVHPLHSYTLLKYDPDLLTNSPLKSASFNPEELAPGDTAWLTGYQNSHRLISEKVNISSFDPLVLPVQSVPQFTQSNTNSIIINNPPAIASGVLLDKRGRVRSWWTNFAASSSSTQTIDRGLPITPIIEMHKQWVKHGKVDIYSLEVGLSALSIASARNYGLSASWTKAFQKSSQSPRVLQVTSRVAGSDAYRQLKEGDLILSIDGKVISDFFDYDKYTQKPTVSINILRDKKQSTLTLKTQLLSSNSTEEVYLWSGALVQTPHRAIATQYAHETKGVYISWYFFGSPANRYGLKPLHQIIEFEGEKVNNLQHFIRLTQKYQQRDYVRVRLLDLIGRELLITLKQDLHYWPTEKISLKNGQWSNIEISQKLDSK